jgi:hypothetical protein
MSDSHYMITFFQAYNSINPKTLARGGPETLKKRVGKTVKRPMPLVTSKEGLLRQLYSCGVGGVSNCLYSENGDYIYWIQPSHSRTDLALASYALVTEVTGSW